MRTKFPFLHNILDTLDGQISFSEALLELTDKEIAYQQQESLKRRIKRARFPIIKRLSEFDYQFQPSINQQQIAEFATMSFLDNQENGPLSIK